MEGMNKELLVWPGEAELMWGCEALPLWVLDSGPTLKQQSL